MRENEIIIKLSLPPHDKNIIASQFLGNSENKFKNCKFYINSDIKEADYWIVIDNIDKDDNKCKIDLRNIFFCTAELPYITNFKGELAETFLRQFSKIFTCHDIFFDNVIASLPFLPWMINAKYHKDILSANERDYNYLSNLKKLDKTKKLSVFCSNKAMNEHQELRLRFVKKIVRV